MRTLARMALILLASPCLAAGSGDYAAVNGLRMYYETHGAATPGRPVLLVLHGGCGTLETSFARLLPLLAANRRVVAIEQQGHGHTADIDRPPPPVKAAYMRAAPGHNTIIEQPAWVSTMAITFLDAGR